MRSDLKEFLDEFKAEVDSIVNTYLDETKAIPSLGVDAFQIGRLKRTVTEAQAIKVAEEYHKVSKAFMILAGDTIRTETRTEVGGDHMDAKGIIRQTTFSNSDLQNIALSVIGDNHIAFTDTLAKIINNNSLSRKYSKAIFGKAPRK